MKLLKSFSVYTVTSLLTAGIPFLVLPVLTRYLSPYDYGLLSLFSTYVLILVPIISLGSDGLIGVNFFQRKHLEFTKLFSSVARFIGLNFLFILIITFLSRNKLESYLELPSKWISILPIVAFLTIIVERFLSQLVNQKKSLIYGGVSVLRVVSEVSLTLLFIIGIGMNWEGRIFSWLITLFLMFSFSIFYFKKEGWLLKKSFDIKLLKKSLFYGLPLVPHILGKFVINQSDIIFIANMASIDDVGIYRLGYQIGTIISVFSTIFLNIIFPFVLERLNDITENKKIEIVRLSYIYFGTLCILTFFLWFFSESVFNLVADKRFASGAKYVFWSSLSCCFWGGYLIFANYIFYLKRSMILTYLSVINISLNLFLNYFLITKYGVIGAAYATTISFFVTFILIAFISNKLYPMPWLFFLKPRKI